MLNCSPFWSTNVICVKVEKLRREYCWCFLKHCCVLTFFFCKWCSSVNFSFVIFIFSLTFTSFIAFYDFCKAFWTALEFKRLFVLPLHFNATVKDYNKHISFQKAIFIRRLCWQSAIHAHSPSCPSVKFCCRESHTNSARLKPISLSISSK